MPLRNLKLIWTFFRPNLFYSIASQISFDYWIDQKSALEQKLDEGHPNSFVTAR